MHLAALMGDFGMAVPAVWAWLASVWGEFVRGTGTTLVASIWQGAVIAFGLGITIRVMPRIPAAHRFAAWAAGFVIAAGLPFMRMHLGVSGTAGASAGLSGGAAAALLQVDSRWALAIAILWVCASALRGVDLAVHSIRLRRLWKTAQPVDISENLIAWVRGVRGGRVRICTTSMLDRPSVIGFWSPRILIPEWLLARLTPGELEQIVLHEMEHLRRCDDWTNLVQKLALVAFPLNPGLAWMEHRLCREREMACDEGVVRITNAPRAYAACLTNLAERRLERRAEALSLGAWHRRSELVHRVHGILLRKRGLSAATAGALLGTMGCALVAGSVEMARCPQLVAFVPQRTLARTAERTHAMDAMLAQENAEQKLTLPPGYHAVQAKAILPEEVQVQHPHRKSAAATLAPKAARSGSAAQLATAEKLGDRVNRDQQQWVVLATWEEVQTVSRSSATTSGDAVADYTTATTNDGIAPGQNSATAGSQKNNKNAGQASNQTSRYTVTQLILRVVPASPNSKSAQPEASIHGGWFVIQL